jgi:low affinity Fe/Cu permease
MVFLIQNTQNRDTFALQVKLSELILALERADNRMAAIEDASDEELQEANEEIKRKVARQPKCWAIVARMNFSTSSLRGRMRSVEPAFATTSVSPVAIFGNNIAILAWPGKVPPSLKP